LLSLNVIKNEHKSKRQNAKATGFAISFGGNGITIARNANISKEEGNKIYNDYMTAFPGVASYFKNCKDKVLKNGYIIVNPLIGKRINFTGFKEYLRLKKEINNDFWEKWKALKELPDYEDNPQFIKLKEILTKKSKLEGKFERSSYNFPIQGTAAEMTKISCIYVFNHILKTNNMFKVLFPLVVHDQLVLEVPIGEEEYWSKVVSNYMVKAGNIFCKSVQITAEPVILDKWQK
jgi:DNA polymerase I-like protein with 3'-5' exonuclease and polymerase domains